MNLEEFFSKSGPPTVQYVCVKWKKGFSPWSVCQHVDGMTIVASGVYDIGSLLFVTTNSVGVEKLGRTAARRSFRGLRKYFISSNALVLK